MQRASSRHALAASISAGLCLCLVGGCVQRGATSLNPLPSASPLGGGAAVSAGSTTGAPSPPTVRVTGAGVAVTPAQLRDLRAPTSVAVYPIAPTPGCSTHMPETSVARLYALALQGTVVPNSDFVQDGITFKIGVFPSATAYTFNARTDILHRPNGGAPELTLRVPAQVGTVLADADRAGCQAAPR